MGSQCAGAGADRAEQVRFTLKDRVGWGEGKEGAGEDERGKGRKEKGRESEEERQWRRRGALPPEVGRSEDKPQHLPGRSFAPSIPAARCAEGLKPTCAAGSACAASGPRPGDPARARVPARAAGAPWRPGAALALRQPALRACCPGSACAGPRRPAPGRVGQGSPRGTLPVGRGRPCGSVAAEWGPPGLGALCREAIPSGHCGREARALLPAPCAPSAMRGADPAAGTGRPGGGDGSLRSEERA